MPASGDPWTPALESLAALRARWPGSDWTWDGRLACAVSSFAIAQEPEARRELAAEFPSEWTADSLPAAPRGVTALAHRCGGGLRPGQLLLCRDAAGGALLFALWWPWGDGTKVSVRIGIEGAPSADGLTQRLREVFQAA